MTIKHGSGHKRLILPGLAMMSATVALGGATGCTWSDFGMGYTTSSYYPVCIDPSTGQVVSMDHCQQNPNYYYISMVPHNYHPGYILPQTYRQGSGYFPASDEGARAKAGLPRTGGISAGTKVVSRSGGFDSSHVGTHAGDGFGGFGHGTGGG